MADIFISYSSKHRDVTRALAEALEPQYSVWWDKELEAYASFRDQIDAALSQARVVIVVWSEGAATSDYVVAEAREALTQGGIGNQGRLVNALAPGFNPTQIPKPMSEFQSEWVENIPGMIRAVSRRYAGDRPEKLDAAGFYYNATGKAVLSEKREALTTVAYVTPALLLNARLALAPYLDVHGLRAGLQDWATQGRPVQGRLIHGPGGLGKTRLMIEVCADLRDQGWAAGFVETPDPHNADIHRQAIEGLIDSDRTPGLMLALDYAERRQDEATRYAELMLKAAQKRPDRPLRLVLLARAAGDWWDRAVAEVQVLMGVFAGGVTQLDDFSEAADRERLFGEAGRGFFAAITQARQADPTAFPGWSENERAIPDRLRGELATDAFERPLMIQIAALLNLQGDVPDAASVAALLDAMLGVERNYWKRALGAKHTDIRQIAVSRGTIQTTLAGGAARSDVEALLRRDGYFKRDVAADVAEPLSDLERIYGDGTGRFVALEPDLLGEHLLASDGDTRLVDACLGWAGDDQKRRRDILTVWQRATRAEHGTRSTAAMAMLEHIIRARPATLATDLIDVALNTPGELPAILEGVAPALNPETAEALHAPIPMYTLRLSRAAGALATRACDSEAAISENEQSRRAHRLTGLGIRLTNLGRREAALTSSTKATEIYRELAAQNRVAHLPNLAISLNNLSFRLSDLGHSDAALTASAEAVEIRRELVTQNRDAFLSDLAASLHNMGADLSNLGRHEAALTASTETVDIYRELAAQNRKAFLPNLAMSLSNRGTYLLILGRFEEALTVCSEALKIRRELVVLNRDAFLPNLATSLTNLGFGLSRLGRRDEALKASEEAVDIYRELAAQAPDAFLPNLAASLSVLGDVLKGGGRAPESVAAFLESAELLKPYADAAPGAFGGLFNQNLSDLVAAMRADGRDEAEIKATVVEFGGDPEKL